MNISKINIIKSNINQNKTPKHRIGFTGKCDTFEKSITVKGTETEAKIYTDEIDEPTRKQIETICSHPVFKNLPIRIMPDTHAEETVPIGFTAPIGTKGEIIPNLISGDIGCGMLCCEIDTNGKEIDFEKLDKIIKNYVANSHMNTPTTKEQHVKVIEKDLKILCNNINHPHPNMMTSVLGTLGRGNHFIEIDKSDNEKLYLIIHSGSRALGQAIHNHYQNIATAQNPYKIETLSYLTGDKAKEYLRDMKLAQKYAQLNRRIIADEIIKQMGWSETSSFESIHNYISDDNIIRKGAISSYAGQKILIPLNMRDGSLIAMGKGNSSWNNSAPHGAGRKLSRTEAHKKIDVEDYKKSMRGIYTSCVCRRTLDESPQAYKDSDKIKTLIAPTADIIEHIKPIYNYKNK